MKTNSLIKMREMVVMERRKVFQKKRCYQHFTLKQLLQIFFDIKSTRKGKKCWNLIKTKKGVLQFARVLKNDAHLML